MNTSMKLSLSAKQVEFKEKIIDDPQVVEALIGGSAGGAKTMSMCIAMMLAIAMYPGIQFALGRKTLQGLNRSTVATLLGKAHPMFGIGPNDYHYDKKDGIITYNNGSKITLLALDYEPSDPDFTRLGSAEFDWAFVDEAGEIGKQAKDVLRSRLGRGIATQQYEITPKLILSCNPSTNFLRTEYYQPYKRLGGGGFQKWQIGEVVVKGEEKPAYRAFLRMSVQDNPFIDKNYYQTLKQLPDRERKRLLDGNWDYSDNDKMLFTGELIEDCTIRELPEMSMIEKCDYLMGVDVADVGCFDDKTEVLTDSGWKLFAEVADTDKILTQDPVTGVATFEQHDGIHYQHYAGTMWNYDSPKISFSVTPNHKMLCRQAMQDTGNSLRSIEDIPWKEWKLVRTHKYHNTMPLQETFSFTSSVNMPNGGARKKTWSFNKKDWFSFLGWFISEGCVIEEAPRHFKISIAQKRETRKSDNIEHLLNKMGIAHTRIGNNFVFYNNPIAMHLLTEVGKYAHSKKIPDYVTYSDDQEAIDCFLTAYCNGDGCWQKGRRLSYFTSSKSIADALQIILANINAAGKMTVSQKAGSKFLIEGREVTRQHDVYCINENHPTVDFIIGKHAKIRQEAYDGMVYCAITKHHTMFVRRNGTCYWTGNTDNSVISIIQNNILIRQIKINLRDAGIGKNSKIDVGDFLSDKVIYYAKHLGFTEKDAKRITIETNGVGASLRDSLRRKKWYVTEYVADVKTRSKMFYSLHELMVDGKVSIFANENIDYDELRRQLTAHEYEIEGDRIKLTSKRDLKRQLGCSPDMADSFAIAMFSRGDAFSEVVPAKINYFTKIHI